MNKDKINLFKYANSTRGFDRRILFTLLVTITLFATTTPIVLSATEDFVVITFDPEGDIDIDVSLAEYNFSTAIAGMWTNSSGGAFTLYNNGTVPMDTRIKTNATTDEMDMSLNASGVPPATDEYAIYIEDVDFPDYLTTTYNKIFDQGLNPDDSKTFDICLYIGVNLSANYSWQTTTIYFQGSVS